MSPTELPNEFDESEQVGRTNETSENGVRSGIDEPTVDGAVVPQAPSASTRQTPGIDEYFAMFLRSLPKYVDLFFEMEERKGETARRQIELEAEVDKADIAAEAAVAKHKEVLGLERARIEAEVDLADIKATEARERQVEVTKRTVALIGGSVLVILFGLAAWKGNFTELKEILAALAAVVAVGIAAFERGRSGKRDESAK